MGLVGTAGLQSIGHPAALQSGRQCECNDSSCHRSRNVRHHAIKLTHLDALRHPPGRTSSSTATRKATSRRSATTQVGALRVARTCERFQSCLTNHITIPSGGRGKACTAAFVRSRAPSTTDAAATRWVNGSNSSAQSGHDSGALWRWPYAVADYNRRAWHDSHCPCFNTAWHGCQGRRTHHADALRFGRASARYTRHPPPHGASRPPCPLMSSCITLCPSENSSHCTHTHMHTPLQAAAAWRWRVMIGCCCAAPESLVEILMRASIGLPAPPPHRLSFSKV